MNRFSLTLGIALVAALTLTGCTNSTLEPSPTSTQVKEEVANELVANAAENTEAVKIGDWEVTASDVILDTPNQFVELFGAPSAAEGLIYGGVPLNFTHKGDAEAQADFKKLEFYLMDAKGKKFNTEVAEELYTALAMGIDLTTLESTGSTSGTKFYQVDPKTKEFYLVLSYDDSEPQAIKLGSVELT